MQDNLIERLVQQDLAALSDLYDKYGPALFGIVLRIVQSRELAEQVVQDTFVKVWKKSADYDPQKGRLFTWLLNIARNTAIDATRTAHYIHYRKTEDAEQLVYISGTDQPNPEHIGIRKIVENLDEKYRELINLVYFKGYTQEEVAEELGVPLGTVKTRLRHAINSLRQIFGTENPGALLLIAALKAVLGNNNF